MRLLEMPLINCKIHLEFLCTKNCEIYGSDAYATTGSNNRETTFKTTNKKLYVPVVTLSTKDNANLTRQLNKGFKETVYWKEYKSKIESTNLNDQNLTRFYLDSSFQGLKRLFVLAFDNTDNGNKKIERNSCRKYFLPRVNITRYNVLIEGRNFYDQQFLMIKLKNMMKLEKIKQDKEIITQQDVC